MSKKIIIIGGGVAGLSAGIYGQKAGFTTEIIEMHTVPGGQCTAWDRKGYRFDYCLHWLVGTRTGAFHNIWRDTGVLDETVKIHDHEIHSRIVDENGNDFIIYSSVDRWEKYLLNLAPEDAKSIRKMCNDMRRFDNFEPFQDPPELRSMKDSLKSLGKILPALPIFAKFGKKTCKEYFDSLHFTNPRLLMFFNSFYADADFSALAFLLMLTWFNQKNAGYLMGGSLPMAMRMADKYKSLGGKLTLGKKVDKIIVEDDTAKGVVLTDGTVMRADYVISAADGHSTLYKMLEGQYITSQIDHAYNNWPLFTPLVQVSFGIDKEVKTDFPAQVFNVKNIRIGSTELKRGYTLMNYGFDPSMAPKGKTTIVMRFESPWDKWENMDEETYRREKRQIETDAIAILEKQYPGILREIVVVDVATPRTNVDYTGVWQGAYEGFLPTSKNLLKSIKMTIPSLDNFYMCGQWLSPGGGLPPSAQSGKWNIDLIRKKEKC